MGLEPTTSKSEIQPKQGFRGTPRPTRLEPRATLGLSADLQSATRQKA